MIFAVYRYKVVLLIFEKDFSNDMLDDVNYYKIATILSLIVILFYMN